MHRGLLAVTLVGVVVLAGVAVGATGSATADSAAAAAAFQEDVDPDDVLLAITVEPDGDAAWTIEYRMRLETDEDEQAFADLQRDIENNSTAYEQRFHDRMNATVDDAMVTTGREMTITDMRVSAEKRELPREYGIVTYRFQWTGFAAVDGDRVTVGDAIDALFLDDDTTLRVAWTAENVLLGSAPAPDETRDAAIVWNGPTSFGRGEPRIDLGPQGAAPDGAGPSVADSPMAFATLLVLLVVVASAVAFVYYRRRDHGTVAGSPGGSDGEAGTAGAPGAAGAAGTIGASGGAASTATGSTAAASAEAIDTELLSNEEQVLRLVERNGGRMKQQMVADELGWTDAKTSQVTKGLREDGDLEGFRLGRENVLALPDEPDGEDDAPIDAGGDTDTEKEGGDGMDGGAGGGDGRGDDGEGST